MIDPTEDRQCTGENDFPPSKPNRPTKGRSLELRQEADKANARHRHELVPREMAGDGAKQTNRTEPKSAFYHKNQDSVAIGASESFDVDALVSVGVHDRSTFQSAEEFLVERLITAMNSANMSPHGNTTIL
jgi:hypothetical protein